MREATFKEMLYKKVGNRPVGEEVTVTGYFTRRGLKLSPSNNLGGFRNAAKAAGYKLSIQKNPFKVTAVQVNAE